jgi:hypothetical protein
VALLAVGLVFWVASAGGDEQQQADDPTATSAVESTSNQPEQESTAAPETSAQESTTAPETSAAPTGDGDVRARDVEKATRDFFKDVPGDLEAAYERTSPGFQSRFSYADFSGFWDDFRDVRLRSVQGEDGSLVVRAEIEYVWPDGTRQTESHDVTFVAAEDGRLLLDSDVQAG